MDNKYIYILFGTAIIIVIIIIFIIIMLSKKKDTYEWKDDTSKCVNGILHSDCYKNNVLTTLTTCGDKTRPNTKCDSSLPDTDTYEWKDDTSKCVNGILYSDCYKNNVLTTLTTCGDKTKPKTPCEISVNDEPRKMITYFEGWQSGKNSISSSEDDLNFHYGTPENYTHAVFAFSVPYHYYGGYCSGLCTPWLSIDSSLLEDDPKNPTQISAKKFIENIKEKNKKIKIIIGFGGWNFNHFQSSGPWDSKTQGVNKYYGCRNICNPSDKSIEDDPSKYTKVNDNNYNCKNVSSSQQYITDVTSVDIIQPSEYCYGGRHNKMTLDEVKETATYVCDKLIKLINIVEADGVDLDLEDTYEFSKKEGPIYTFYTTIIDKLYDSKLKNGNRPIITLAPLNAYVIGSSLTYNNKRINSGYAKLTNDENTSEIIYFSNVSDVFLKYLENWSSKLDYISVQYYNGAPNVVENDQEVKISYDYLVTNIFKGNASKVVIGMCSINENSETLKSDERTCKECDYPNESCNNVGKDGVRYKLINYLSNTYSNFGGVMQWAANGDENGSFSNNILEAMKTKIENKYTGWLKKI